MTRAPFYCIKCGRPMFDDPPLCERCEQSIDERAVLIRLADLLRRNTPKVPYRRQRDNRK